MSKCKFLIEQEIYVIQHHENGDHFFEGCKNYKEAAEKDWQKHFYIDEIDQIDGGTDENDVLSYEEQRENHRNQFEEYTKDQILKAAENYDWPFDCGILENNS